MAYNIQQRDTCRVCNGKNLRCFLSFDQMPFTDGFVSSASMGSEFLAPIRVYWCTDCRTAQTLHNVEVLDYYREYRYTVSNSAFARSFMQRLAEATFKRFDLRPGDSAIEVGSGDGYQLKCFRDVGARILGFEPSDDLTRMSREAGVPVAQCLFHSGTVKEIPAEMRPAQVILLTYTFDHLPDPLSFLNAVREAIDPVRGVLVIEVHDLDKILERRETCLFEHEHSIYLNLRTMSELLARAGFKLLTADLLPEKERRGNSLLIAAALQQSVHQPDTNLNLTAPSPAEEWAKLEGFGQSVKEGHQRLRDHIRKARAAGRRVAGYGAGGRGVMTIAQAGLDANDLVYVCDQNTTFHGLFTPHSHIPVVPPKRIATDAVDEVIVFSFGYLAEIQQELKKLGWTGRLTSMLELI